ncbi:hypothetical protein BK139_08880 [Paenibacillus sp. FSL R5-0490]|uniref:hypothetical protein n=1 Tax=Bacillales TaxID=1385 RepID=UPI00096F966C|nr:hypothetical protein [Paenibacillus sp. FSL R5-0490]OMF60967.1 hypothetical protein BK139_08880 [Paenibacillus sp. FSL R5-0490]
MEHRIESSIDNFLATLSPFIELGNMGFGVILFIFGIFFILQSPSKRSVKLIGVFCSVAGAAAIVSGIFQI